MSEWLKYPLDEIMQIVKTSYKVNDGANINYIGLEHIGQGTLRLCGMGNSNEVQSNKYYFKKGDVLFGKLRPYFRKVVQVDFDGICSTDIWVCRSKDICDQDYLFYFLATKDFVDMANITDEGTRMPRADWGFMKSTEWSLPSLEEQRKIVSVLKPIDKKIDLLRDKNITLEGIMQTYFRQWFIEDVEGDTCSVSNLAILDNESINPSRTPLELYSHYSIPAFDDDKTPSLELGKEILSNKYSVKPRTILVSKLNPSTPRIWRIGNVVANNSVCSTELQVLKPLEDKYWLFVYCLMKTSGVNSTFAMSATGTSGSHQRIRPEYILEVEVVKPDETKLEQFNELCKAIAEEIDCNEALIKTLVNLRETLLPKLISGDCEVGE